MGEPSAATDADGEPVPVVLASASPRRLALLRRIGVEPQVCPSDVDESVRTGEGPSDYVRRLAVEKAAAVDAPGDALVIAADTTVVLDERMLAKPADEADAARMLASLSGRLHLVLTGVAVRRGNRRSDAVESTEVRFRTLGGAEIAAYVATGEPLDKAGGYGIQGAAGMFVAAVSGSDTNVVGLPLTTVVELAADVGVTLLPR